jgi:2-polyprenyl-3-methyl-5-hydroxy-6-metoxy-1,4-benzoquinol methylase/uncharacterized protein YbaR (Trm112 family)
MRRALLDILVCPVCEGERPLSLAADAKDSDEVIEGTLSCSGCDRQWPVQGGIPRFVDAAENYARGFGYQWRLWREVQIDRLNGHDLTESRLLHDTAWEAGWIDGKLILDAGCGAGRFSDVLGTLGARVVAIDLSEAVEACRTTCAHHGAAFECVQASIFALPFRKACFEGVHCTGVIQHTPDPRRIIETLPLYLRPGGRLAYNFYEKGLARRLQFIKYGLRLITPSMKPASLLWLTRFLVAVFFPLTLVLNRIRFVRYIIRFLPICASHFPPLTLGQQYRWTLLDTFDWYNPRYEISQDHREVAEWLRGAGVTGVEAAPGIARGTVP